MEPGRSTLGIWLMAATLGGAGLILDAPAFFLASFSLVLLSALLALRFRERMHGVAMSAHVTRLVSRKTLRQGGGTMVTTGFSCTVIPQTTVTVRDILPFSAIIDPEDPAAATGADGIATVQYTLTPLMPGSIAFPGILLTVADPFFTGSLAMGTPPFSGPVLEVYPHAIYEKSASKKDFGEQEKDKVNVHRGAGVRSIREYVHGDDPRLIDWKMTAKHDKMFIREHTSVENFAPLIILDLPDRSFPVPDEAMAQLVNSATGEIITGLRTSGSINLFLISGINIIDIILEEKDLPRIMAVIRSSAHPAFRLHHAYRWKDRAAIRGYIRKRGSMPPGTDTDIATDTHTARFSEKITQVYRKSLTTPYSPVFATRLRHLLDSLDTKDIVLFSLFEGDQSHIREIVTQAHALGFRLKPRTAPGQDPGKMASAQRVLGKETIEVIA